MLMNVVLGGKTTSGFDQLEGKISSLGAALSQISDYALEFEKESVETYKSYETYMLEAQGALTAQYASQSQLARVMEGLDEHAQSWAASTIFDTQDVSKAISEAAHAGWDYEQMLEGIPSAMLLAQAGNIDLSTGLDYVIKALNATGTEFEDADVLIDQWAMAANSGATNISELGEALLRMGATARFGDSTAELFTMLAVLADMGTVGAEAGTLLRNSMIRLIAPTEKASDVMAQLGVTQEEALEIASDDATLQKANELLSETGFSAYDSEGKLKPFLDIYKELYAAVSGMAEVDKNAVLSAIFPTRTITGALGLLEAAADDYDGLYQKISGSDGYAGKVADIQTSGLMGTLEELDSKWEEFQRKIGETSTPGVEAIAGFFGDIVDNLNEMDEAQLSALVGGITTIAAAGPALTVAGGAMKLFSTLGPIGTAALLAAVGMGALVGYASKMNELNFEAAFGDMQLDLDELGTHVDSLKTKFDEEETAISEWATALETAQTEYSELATLLSEDLLSSVLTGKTLAEEDKAALQQYGTDMVDAVMIGIDNARARDLTFLDMLFGDMTTDDETQAFIDSVDWTNNYYDDLYADAAEIGQKLRSQMTEALRDSSINEEERQAIQDSVDRLNQIQAEIANTMAQEEYYAQLHKAQRVSWDSISEYLAENAEKQAADLTSLDESYDALYGHQRAAWQNEYDSATTDAQRAELESQWANWETQFNREWADARESTTTKYGELTQAAFTALMNDSDHAAAWDFIQQVYKDGIPLDEYGQYDFDRLDWGKYFANGAPEDISSLLIDLSNANSEWFGLADGKLTKMLEPYKDFAGVSEMLDMLDSAFGLGSAATAYENRKYMFEEYGQDPLGEFTVKVTPEVEAGSLDAALGDEAVTAPVEVPSGAEDAGAYAGEFQGALDGNVPDATVTYPDGYADGAAYASSYQAALSANPGRYTVRVSSSGGGLFSNKMALYADGGRATEPSIFGEAGAEWAIPEEHSARTADLLNAAREASGFTWGELLNLTGGLNSNPNHQPIHIQYAPVVHAADASGVDQVLLNDKNRLMSMMRELMAEMAMRDDVEVYA